MPDVMRKIQSLEDASTHIQFQVAVTKTAFKTHQKNEELHTALKGALDENAILLKEVEVAFITD